jgi:23S rRNA G2445 N2-methylase RlmL
MLMATDPRDLLLDPTCGSGTTAYVAEQWDGAGSPATLRAWLSRSLSTSFHKFGHVLWTPHPARPG